MERAIFLAVVHGVGAAGMIALQGGGRRWASRAATTSTSLVLCGAIAWLGRPVADQRGAGPLGPRSMMHVVEELFFHGDADLFSTLSLVFFDMCSISSKDSESLGQYRHSKGSSADRNNWSSASSSTRQVSRLRLGVAGQFRGHRHPKANRHHGYDSNYRFSTMPGRGLRPDQRGADQGASRRGAEATSSACGCVAAEAHPRGPPRNRDHCRVTWLRRPAPRAGRLKVKEVLVGDHRSIICDERQSTR